MPHLLTPDEEADMLNKLQGLTESIQLLKRGTITKWKLKMLYEQADSMTRRLNQFWKRYEFIQKKLS